MICYYTRVYVKEEFNKSILLEMYKNWLDNSTKNKMEGLNYQGEESYVYIENNKTIRVEEFIDNHIFGIEFLLKDIYRKSYFKVEVLYNYVKQYLELSFYKEIDEESKFIDTISIPNIFTNLLSSPYIKDDSQLHITKKPLFLQSREYHEISKNKYQLPIIVLNRHHRCAVDPNRLNDKVFGIAHVLCVSSKKDDLKVKIVYPDGFSEIIESDTQNIMLNNISEKVRLYMISESHQYYSFEELMRLKLHKEHQLKEEENKNIEDDFQIYIEELKKEVEALEKIYKDNQQEYNELLAKNKSLEEKRLLKDKKSLLISKKKDNDKYRELIIDILDNYVRSLPLEGNYRRKDIIESVLGGNR